MVVTKSIFFIFLLMLLTGCKDSTVKIKDEMFEVTPAAIIDQVEQTYKSAKSYSDSGKVVIFNKGPLDTLEVIFFKTLYSNNHLFSFEFSKKDKANYLYKIHHDKGKPAHSWWSVTNQNKTYKHLSQALGAARGISIRASTIIPTLLLPEETHEKNILRWINHPELKGKERIERVNFYKLVGETNYKELFSIWISEEDNLIHKIEYRYASDSSLKARYEFFVKNE